MNPSSGRPSPNRKTLPPKNRRSGFFQKLASLTASLFLLALSPIYASETPPAIDPELTSVVEKLLAQKMNPEEVQALFTHPKLRFNPTVPSLFFIIQESKLDYGQFASPDSIKKAVAYMKTHEKALAEAESAFAVPKEIICAILLVETRLGTFMGNHTAAASLASIAALNNPKVQNLIWERVKNRTHHDRASFEARAKNRADWALKEIPPLMRYARKKGISAADIQGSYAGAVGICQFMPSNIEAYGADGDKDGKIRLSSHTDAIHSAARYLKKNGWKQGMNLEQQEKIILTYNKSRPYAQAVLKVASELRKNVS